MTLVNPDSGRVHKHPAVGVAEVAAQLRALAGEFDLSSGSRAGTLAIPVVVAFVLGGSAADGAYVPMHDRDSGIHKAVSRLEERDTLTQLVRIK